MSYFILSCGPHPQTLLRGKEEKEDKLRISSWKMHVQLPDNTVSVMMSIDLNVAPDYFLLLAL